MAGLLEYVSLSYRMEYDYLGNVIKSVHSRINDFEVLNDKLDKMKETRCKAIEPIEEQLKGETGKSVIVGYAI